MKKLFISYKNRVISCILVCIFAFQTVLSVEAQSVFASFPQPLTLSGAKLHGLTPRVERGIQLHGLKVNPAKPLELDFIIGDERREPSDKNQSPEFKNEANKLIKYFLASLTTPENEMWVNLSPNEPDRIIAKGLGQTELGRDMLAQDYILKQITSSFFHPDNEYGKQFWNKVYATAFEQYGTTDVPIDTFNKVWIVPEKAEMYENDGAAYILNKNLKVLMEEDYLSRRGESVYSSYNAQEHVSSSKNISLSVMQEIIIPVIEYEVNHGYQFAQLRQIYDAMILATWYKHKIKESIINQVYTGQNKTRGIDHDDNKAVEKIYNQYLSSVKDGVFNFIKEEHDALTDETLPRQYFSGGLEKFDFAQLSFRQPALTELPDNAMSVSVELRSDSAMRSSEAMEKFSNAFSESHTTATSEDKSQWAFDNLDDLFENDGNYREAFDMLWQDHNIAEDVAEQMLLSIARHNIELDYVLGKKSEEERRARYHFVDGKDVISFIEYLEQYDPQIAQRFLTLDFFQRFAQATFNHIDPSGNRHYQVLTHHALWGLFNILKHPYAKAHPDTLDPERILQLTKQFSQRYFHSLSYHYNMMYYTYVYAHLFDDAQPIITEYFFKGRNNEFVPFMPVNPEFEYTISENNRSKRLVLVEDWKQPRHVIDDLATMKSDDHYVVYPSLVFEFDEHGVIVSRPYRAEENYLPEAFLTYDQADQLRDILPRLRAQLRQQLSPWDQDHFAMRHLEVMHASITLGKVTPKKIAFLKQMMRIIDEIVKDEPHPLIVTVNNKDVFEGVREKDAGHISSSTAQPAEESDSAMATYRKADKFPVLDKKDREINAVILRGITPNFTRDEKLQNLVGANEKPLLEVEYQDEKSVLKTFDSFDKLPRFVGLRLSDGLPMAILKDFDAPVTLAYYINDNLHIYRYDNEGQLISGFDPESKIPSDLLITKILWRAAKGKKDRDRVAWDYYYAQFPLMNGLKGISSTPQTWHNRYQHLNDHMLELLDGRDDVRIADLAVSDGITSLDLYQMLSNAGKQVTMHASDGLMNVHQVRIDNHLAFFNDDGKPFEYVIHGSKARGHFSRFMMGDQVVHINEEDEYRSVVSKNIFKERFKDGDFETISRVHPAVELFIENNPDADFVIDQMDILHADLPYGQYDLVRAGNLIQYYIYHDASLKRLLAQMASRVNEGGHLLLTHEEDVYIWKRTRNDFDLRFYSRNDDFYIQKGKLASFTLLPLDLSVEFKQSDSAMADISHEKLIKLNLRFKDDWNWDQFFGVMQTLFESYRRVEVDDLTPLFNALQHLIQQTFEAPDDVYRVFDRDTIMNWRQNFEEKFDRGTSYEDKIELIQANIFAGAFKLRASVDLQDALLQRKEVNRRVSMLEGQEAELTSSYKEMSRLLARLKKKITDLNIRGVDYLSGQKIRYLFRVVQETREFQREKTQDMLNGFLAKFPEIVSRLKNFEESDQKFVEYLEQTTSNNYFVSRVLKDIERELDQLFLGLDKDSAMNAAQYLLQGVDDGAVLRSFLEDVKQQLFDMITRKKPLNRAKIERVSFILGNEAADMDSIVSAIVHAYVMSQSTSGHKILFVPVINCVRAEFRLKGDVYAVLTNLGIREENLVFANDLNWHNGQTGRESFRQGILGNNFSIELIDHNKLAWGQRRLSHAVEKVTDHHVDRETAEVYGYQTQPVVHIDPKVRSVTSLLADQIVRLNLKVPDIVRRLLLLTMIKDTSQFRFSRHKDVIHEKALAIRFYEMQGGQTGSDPFGLFMEQAYGLLKRLRRNTRYWSAEDFLQADRKGYYGLQKEGVDILRADENDFWGFGISATSGLGIKDLINQGILQSLPEFFSELKNKKLIPPQSDAFFVMTRKNQRRKLIIYMPDQNKRLRLLNYLSKAKSFDKIELSPRIFKDKSGILSQINSDEKFVVLDIDPRISRKRMGPILERFFAKEVKRGADDAMNVPGGIDLNPQQMDFKINENIIGNGLRVFPSEQFSIPANININPAEFKGFLPIIINIQPINNLPIYLGLK